MTELDGRSTWTRCGASSQSWSLLEPELESGWQESQELGVCVALTLCHHGVSITLLSFLVPSPLGQLKMETIEKAS